MLLPGLSIRRRSKHWLDTVNLSARILPVMDIEEAIQLTQEQISNLKKNGHQIDTSPNKVYYGLFLFNDKLNQATDPIPFQIDSSILDKVAKSLIGRPHVVRPEDIIDPSKPKDEIKNNVGEHVRGEIDDPKKIIEFQKNYAIGDMETYYINPVTNNVYGIYAAYPEYEYLILEKRIPPGTSPLLEPRKMEGHKVLDAIGLHVQSVKSTGYDPKLAKITGTCTGMLDECTSQLRTMGASKQLIEYRRNLLNSTKQQGNSEMVDLTPEEMMKEINTVKAELEKAQNQIKTLGANGGQVLELPQEIKEKLENFDVIKKESEETKTQLNELIKKTEAEKAEAEAKERLKMAEIITNGEILTKEITDDKKDERVKYWFELKDEKSGQLKDISLLAEKFMKMTPKTIGSSGLTLEDIFPQMGVTDNQTNSTFDIMEELS